MTRLRADLILLAIAVVWGLAFVFQKTAMEHIGPFTFLAARAALAAAVLFLLASREDGRTAATRGASFWRLSLLAGVAFFLGGILQQIGLVTVTVTNSGFLTGLYVVFTPLMVWAIWRRAPHAGIWVAVGLAFLGTWFLGGGTIGGFRRGDWLVALSAIFWAVHILIVGQAAMLGRPIAFTAVQFAVVAVLALAGAMLLEEICLEALQAALPQILFVGLVSSALTFTLLAVAMRHTPPAEAAILVSTETVFAALAGALLLGEQLALIGWMGAAMMLGATLIVQLGPALGAARRSRL